MKDELTIATDEGMLALAEDGLNARQRLFVDAYTGGAIGNATGAARLAGYSGDEHTLASTGYRLLQVPQVAASIAARFMALSMTQAEVTMQLTRVGRMTVSELTQVIKDENKFGPAVVKVDLGPKVKALEILARTHGMIVERQRTEQSGEVKITIHHDRKPLPEERIIEGTARSI